MTTLSAPLAPFAANAAPSPPHGFAPSMQQTDDITQQDTALQRAITAATLSASIAPLAAAEPPAYPTWLNDLQQHSTPTTSIPSATASTMTQHPLTTSNAVPAWHSARQQAECLRATSVRAHLGTEGVWPTEITMSPLDIIALPVEEWTQFRPDHGIVVAVASSLCHEAQVQ